MKRFNFLTMTIVLIVMVSACGHFNCGFSNNDWGMMNMGHGGMFMWMILLIILIVLAAYWFIKAAKSKDNNRLPGETPLDILKRRYAAGEITKEQFETMKKNLEE